MISELVLLVVDTTEVDLELVVGVTEELEEEDTIPLQEPKRGLHPVPQ